MHSTLYASLLLHTFLFMDQMSTETSIVDQLKSFGLLRTKGLIGGKRMDAYDGRTTEIIASLLLLTEASCLRNRRNWTTIPLKQ